MRISIIYALLFIALGFWAPIALALLLQEVPRGSTFFRIVFYLPAVLSGVVVIFLWKSFYAPQGLMNQLINLGVWLLNLLPGVHLQELNYAWLERPGTALLCTLLPTVWVAIGPGCLIYLAALKTVPDELYEAADIDGAGIRRKVFNVALPSIRALIAINFIGAVIGAVRGASAFVLAMTGGAPFGEHGGATEVIGLKIFYTTFGQLQFGVGAAMAWVLGSMLIGFTVLQLQRLSRIEFRSGGSELMPIISRVGRRSRKMRIAIALVYAALAAGALSMLYPMILMLSGSVRSDTDFVWVTPVPEYLFDDRVLWMKYIESKYGLLPDAEAALHRPIGSWRNLSPPKEIDTDRVKLFDEFRRTVTWPVEWYTMGHSMSERPVPGLIPGQNTRRYRAAAREKYGTIQHYSDVAGIRYPAWSYVAPPMVWFGTRRFTFPQTPMYALYYEVKAQTPLADRVIVDLDGQFWRTYLAPVWATVGEYNRAHGTHYTDYRDVLLDTTPPPPGPRRTDWEDFVRNDSEPRLHSPRAIRRSERFMRFSLRAIAMSRNSTSLGRRTSPASTTSSCRKACRPTTAHGSITPASSRTPRRARWSCCRSTGRDRGLKTS